MVGVMNSTAVGGQGVHVVIVKCDLCVVLSVLQVDSGEHCRASVCHDFNSFCG